MKNIISFQNKVVAVTGGASGIGAALCRRFGREGARIAVIDMDRKRVAAQVGELEAAGIDAAGFTCDVSRQVECEVVMEEIIRLWGGIDVLAANAGITQRSPFLQTELSVYRRVMDVNFFGALYCAHAAIKSLIERRGLILVTSSLAGFSPLIGRTGYSASKHALHGLFESLRTEVKPLGVHVMMVCPGFTKTNLQTRALGGDGKVTTHPQSTAGKVDSPDSVAEAVFRGAAARKDIVVLTTVGRITYYLHRLAPALYEKIMAGKLASEIDMDAGSH
ncbi:MAG TPA: SDR family oxidoreductase [Spirochaetota bacterium]|nr:SDR family oxidoreductase [Spirochaetota bacterium]HOD14390.1 SDR family oxidoreductase [Spirochaetota bacterium]HPG50993.1 SDR family oxidoreductase [Spirochaetota bacterium]HPN11750.1 SDR family oxidoreductase [Spirochaetota bacterium]HQL81912.1 SDR family oxidoreductase [Spirochaetota bacterium]